ncbi:uncharacterized protein LAJ45_02315 [Morchella importuna]|nr:uncharacterized protein LAJ45_02315 [Morchella importuna]KAH8153502.1 hypothetical protein LAJ45_02315 [Morchella importuna]
MSPKNITIIGSLNTDLVTRTRRLPAPGETLTAKSFNTAPGGKGANQAAAAARLSGDGVVVKMVGCVGGDEFGRDLKQALVDSGVDVEGVVVDKVEKSGTAIIIVDEDTAENRILINLGANAKVTKVLFPDSYFTSMNPPISALLMQLEIPLQTVLHLLNLADAAGITSIFNPAPAVPIPVNFYPKMDHLIVNETEAALLTGEEVEELDVEAAAKTLLERGVKGSVVITLGAKGGYFSTVDGKGGWMKPEVMEPKDVVDTTGAGDTFVGAFAVAIVEGKSVEEAVKWAGVAAGRKVRKRGAMAGIPWRNEL